MNAVTTSPSPTQNQQSELIEIQHQYNEIVDRLDRYRSEVGIAPPNVSTTSSKNPDLANLLENLDHLLSSGETYFALSKKYPNWNRKEINVLLKEELKEVKINLSSGGTLDINIPQRVKLSLTEVVTTILGGVAPKS